MYIINVYIYIYIHKFMHIYIDRYINIDTYIHKYIHIYIYIYIHKHKKIHTYIYTNTYKDTYIHNKDLYIHTYYSWKYHLPPRFSKELDGMPRSGHSLTGSIVQEFHGDEAISVEPRLLFLETTQKIADCWGVHPV
jgi:hypothetical protein